MTSVQKTIIKSLLAGHYLRKSVNYFGNQGYKLFTSGHSVIRFFRERSVDTIGKKLQYTIFKKDGSGRITLNLRNVRRLHGRSMIKQLYKRLRHEQVDK